MGEGQRKKAAWEAFPPSDFLPFIFLLFFCMQLHWLQFVWCGPDVFAVPPGKSRYNRFRPRICKYPGYVHRFPLPFSRQGYKFLAPVIFIDSAAYKPLFFQGCQVFGDSALSRFRYSAISSWLQLLSLRIRISLPSRGISRIFPFRLLHMTIHSAW